MKRFALVPAALVLFLAQCAGATTLTFSFSGIVTSTAANSVAISEVMVGDEVSGQFSFDSSAVDAMAGDSHSGLYEATEFYLTVDGYTYSATGNNISITNDAVLIQGLSALDAYEIVTPLRNVTGPSLSDLPIAQIDLVLVDTDATVFSDDSLPTSVDINEFEITSEDPYGTTGGRIIFQSLSTGEIGEIRFEITDLSPEAQNVSVYFPHVAAYSPWKTEIGIINTQSSTNLTGTLNAYSDSGILLESLEISLAPHARQELEVSQTFSDPDNIGYLILLANSDDLYGYTKFYIDGTYRVAIPATRETNSDEIYLSHIASTTDWWTGVSIVNTTGATKEISIDFDNGSSIARSIAAGEHQAFTINSLFGGVPQPDINSAVITNGSGLVGLELFGSSAGSGNKYLSGIQINDETATNLYYPHIENDPAWWTGVVAFNPSSSSATLTINPFSSGGTPLTPQDFTVAAGGKYIGVTSLLDLPAQTAWFSIDASSPITGFELFGTSDGMQLAGYTGVDLKRKNGVFAKLEINGWTGIAFVNCEEAVASVSLVAYADSGAEVTETTLNLSGHEKIVGLPETIFPSDISSATYIGFSADRDVVGFQLNGSADNTQLDGLPGL